MIVVTGTVEATEETFERVRDASLAHVRRSREEPGCLSHSVQIDCEAPLRFVFLERWSDRAALDAHFAAPSAALLVATLRELRVRATGPVLYDVIVESRA